MTLKAFSQCAAFGALLLLHPAAHAQNPKAQPFDQTAFLKSAEEQESQLFIDGKLIPLSKLFEAKVSDQPITFTEPATAKLDPPDLHDKLLKSTLVVGLYYKCHDCDQMHFETGGGFAVAKGGIVSTCAHMMDLQPKLMLEAYPVAIDSNGRVYPIDQILAYDAAADTCLVHVAGGDFPPLPMRKDGRVGEAVYCLSHPGTNLYIFTAGMLSRVEKQTDGRDRTTLDVSCEYSPGSSGSPITDAAGNVLAQVDKIYPQMLYAGGEKGPAATVYNLRRATASVEITRLGDPANRAAFPSPPKAQPKADKKSAEKPATGAIFGVGNDYELVITPANFDLPGKVKSFADLYALNAANKSKFTPWSSDDKPNSTLQLNYQATGFSGNTGYYRKPGTDGPPTKDNTIARSIGFKFTFTKLEPSTVGLHVAVNDTRYTEKAAPHEFNVDATIPRKDLQFVKLGAPQKGEQVWLAIQINKIMENAEAAAPPPVKMLPGNKIHLKFTAADGREVDTDKMRGKVILVDFWATWCGPCIEALPRLEALYEKYHDRGLEIIGINLDENRMLMDKFLETHKHPWPQSVSAPMGKNPLADPLGFDSIPTFLLIDKEGVYKSIDARNPDTEEKIEALLK